MNLSHKSLKVAPVATLLSLLLFLIFTVILVVNYGLGGSSAQARISETCSKKGAICCQRKTGNRYCRYGLKCISRTGKCGYDLKEPAEGSILEKKNCGDGYQKCCSSGRQCRNVASDGVTRLYCDSAGNCAASCINYNRETCWRQSKCRWDGQRCVFK